MSRSTITGMVLIAMAAAGCAAVRTGIAEEELVRSNAGPFEKVLVVAMSRQAGLRERIERELAAPLEARGVEAVAASSYFGLAAEPPTRAEVRSVLEQDGFDGVLVARLTSRGARYREVPVTAGDPLWHHGFYSYYWGAWPYVYSPSYLERVQLVALELRLFGTADEARLAYRATSEEFELDWAARAIENVADELAGRLVADGLVAPGGRGSRLTSSRPLHRGDRQVAGVTSQAP